jgi:hypothetical protein
MRFPNISSGVRDQWPSVGHVSILRSGLKRSSLMWKAGAPAFGVDFDTAQSPGSAETFYYAISSCFDSARASGQAHIVLPSP